MKALGIDEKGPDAQKQLESRIANPTAQDVVALKKADNDFKVQMQQLGIREDQLNAEDRASAREMAGKTSIYPQILLSSIYTLGYVLVLYLFLAGKAKINADLTSEFNIVLGVLTAAQVQIMNFWFGSSSGSKDKTNKLVAPGT